MLGKWATKLTEMEKTEKIHGLEFLLGYEKYFDKMVYVAAIRHNKKEVVPCHGYCAPHPLAKKSKAYAKKIGYKFRNW